MNTVKHRGRSSISVSKIVHSKFKIPQYSLPDRSSLAVSVPVVNASAHFGRVACYYCKSWDILFLR